MNTARYGITLVVISSLALALCIIGCGSRAQSAQALFDKGEYQQVVDKYPDLEVARRAHAKMADDLLKDKKYTEILTKYADTPAAFKAKMAMAQAMFDAGRYQAVIDSFPGSPLVILAKNKIADSLFAAGALDELITRFPDNDKAKQVKEDRANQEFAQIKKLRGAAKKSALEAFMTKYSGTVVYKDAGAMLSKIREAEAKKNAPKK